MRYQKRDDKQEIKSTQRGAGPIRVVPTPRLNGSASDALREAHRSLARAEQNLFSLLPGIAGAPSSAAFAGPFNGHFGRASPGAAWAAPSQAFADPASAVAHAPAGAWGPSATPPCALAQRTLACDIADEGKRFVCRIELPGVQPDQVDLFCFGRTILLDARREADADAALLVQSERAALERTRAIPLPAEVQPDACTATLRDGILTVSLPKASPTESPRRIGIQPGI